MGEGIRRASLLKQQGQNYVMTWKIALKGLTVAQLAQVLLDVYGCGSYP
jgi:hypothetical protein